MTVEVDREGAPSSQETTLTGTDGQYGFTDLASGRYRVRVSDVPPGYQVAEAFVYILPVDDDSRWMGIDFELFGPGRVIYVPVVLREAP